MNGLRGALIGVFAGMSCADIESAQQPLLDAFPGSPSYDDLLELPGFTEEFSRVKTAKRHIELIEEKFPAHVPDQALQCLNLLKDRRAQSAYVSDDYHVTRDMVKRTLYLEWPAADRVAFDKRLKVFDEWSDFFVSYTNRNAKTTNLRYKSLVSHQYGWPGPAKSQQYNYVARVVAKFLEQQNLRGFVDYKGLKCGDEIGETIDTHCASTHAFVQIVEDAALTEPAPPTLNWCYREYTAFKQAPAAFGHAGVNANRCFFVLASPPPLSVPAAMAQLYQAWYADMAGQLHVVMDDHNKAPFDGLRLKVKEIAEQIVHARTQLIESMLASWP